MAELEQQVEQMGAQVEDRTSLLESVQSDRTTLSRALSQNKELKAQLAELQNVFVKLVRDISGTLHGCGFVCLSVSQSVCQSVSCFFWCFLFVFCLLFLFSLSPFSPPPSTTPILLYSLPPSLSCMHVYIVVVFLFLFLIPIEIKVHEFY